MSDKEDHFFSELLGGVFFILGIFIWCKVFGSIGLAGFIICGLVAFGVAFSIGDIATSLFAAPRESNESPARKTLSQLDNKKVDMIQKNFESKSSDELLMILKENKKEEWVDEAFEAIRRILITREINYSHLDLDDKQSSPDTTEPHR